MTRRVCIVTGTRAEYGLLRGVIAGVAAEAALDLQLIVTAAHLSSEFGQTWREIAADGWTIDARVEMLLSSDSEVGVAKAIGLGVIGFADAFDRLRPDIVVLLGDRFEILAAATAAMTLRIPIAHIHGGETSEGAIDEAIRHAVTKMSHVHFVAAEPYRRRVIQLGESPDRVHLVGGLGVDAIARLDLLERTALEDALGFELRDRNLLITFHPVTLEGDDGMGQVNALLDALGALDANVGLIFTMPNADSGGREIAAAIRAFVARRPASVAFASLGQLRYLSCLAHVDGVVGNSSSGLAEAPSFGIGTIDIGSRQAGRLAADSVIHSEPETAEIAAALARLLSDDFRASLADVANPYGKPGAGAAIVAWLRDAPFDGLLHKRFHDIAVAGAA